MIPRDQIIQADCTTLVPQLEDGSVTAMITDPPYPNGVGLFTDDLTDGLAMLYLACRKVTKAIIFFWRASDVPRPPADPPYTDHPGVDSACLAPPPQRLRKERSKRTSAMTS